MTPLFRLIATVQASDLPPLGLDRALSDLLSYLSPYTEYVIILLVFWLFARRGGKKQGDFSQQAQQVLDELYQKGEISRKAYEKFRQNISLRPKR